MTEIFKILVIALVSVASIILLRSAKSNLSEVLTTVCSVSIFVYIADSLYKAFYEIYDIANLSVVNSLAVETMIRIVGIGYIAEFGNSICVDAKCQTIGEAMLMFAKVSILLTALPLIKQLFEVVLGLFQ